MTTYTASYVFPVAGPVLERGTITIDGEKIQSVNPHGERTADVDFGNAAIIPGLVNAHTHLDLTGAKGKAPPTDPEHFCDWLKGVIAYRKSRSAEAVNDDISEGLAECLKFGTTLLADVAVYCSAAWPALQNAAIRGVVFKEMIGLNDEWQDTYFNAVSWLRKTRNRARTRKGLSPHAPYTVRSSLCSLTAQACRKGRVPTAMHLAESPPEVELIEHRTGSFVKFLQEFGFRELKYLAASFLELIDTFSNPGPRLFIHGNYLHPVAPWKPNQSMIYCPRTHAAFRHPRHPFAEFLARGVNVALGTDSLASNPDLDLLAEAKYVFDHRKDVDGATVLKMATLNGAKALGWADECGSLEPGKSADFVVVPVANDDAKDPHEVLFADISMPRRTMFRGQWREEPRP